MVAVQHSFLCARARLFDCKIARGRSHTSISDRYYRNSIGHFGANTVSMILIQCSRLIDIRYCWYIDGCEFYFFAFNINSHTVSVPDRILIQNYVELCTILILHNKIRVTAVVAYALKYHLTFRMQKNSKTNELANERTNVKIE